MCRPLTEEDANELINFRKGQKFQGFTKGAGEEEKEREFKRPILGRVKSRRKERGDGVESRREKQCKGEKPDSLPSTFEDGGTEKASSEDVKNTPLLLSS